jgi:hypothetical protein
MSGAHCGQHFFGVALRRDVVPDFVDLAVAADPERHAHDAEERFSEERFHPARAIGFDHVELRVGKQREIQFVLGLELRLCFDGIAAAADDGRVELFECADGVTKLGRFVRSTGRVGFRVEIKDQILPAKIAERNRLAVVGRCAEVGRFVAFFEHVLVSGHTGVTTAPASKFHSRAGDSPGRAFHASPGRQRT